MFDRLAIRLLTASTARARARRGGERGAQSLEYIGLGAAVATAMAAAAAYGKTHGADIGQAMFKPIQDMLSGGR